MDFRLVKILLKIYNRTRRNLTDAYISLHFVQGRLRSANHRTPFWFHTLFCYELSNLQYRQVFNSHCNTNPWILEFDSYTDLEGLA